MLYNRTHVLAVKVNQVSGGRHLSFLACNLLWPCSLIETSDRVKRDSLITKGFIFEVFQSVTEAKRNRELWR